MRKVMTMAIAGGTAVVLAGGTLAYGSYAGINDVTVSVDGKEQQVQTRADTVEDVLAKQDITVGKHDVVAPALDAPVDDGTRIAVKYGREVTFTVDGVERTVWTTATSVKGLLTSLGLKAEDAKLSTSRSAAIGRDGLDLSLNTLKQVTVIVKGKPVTIETTGNKVSDALKKAKVKADDNDEVSAKPADLLVNGMKITYVKVDYKKVTETKAISHDSKKVKTDDLYEGETETKTEGVAGERTLTYTLRLEDGKEVKRGKTGDKVTRKPVTEVILVGTKEKPAPPPPPSNDNDGGNSGGNDGGNDGGTSGGSSGGSSSKKAPAAPSGGVWDRLAQCESGGNWSINTGNGFYGGLQFTHSTWQAFGGGAYANNAHQASRAQQIAIAKKVQATQGWGAWPACTSKLGIR